MSNTGYACGSCSIGHWYSGEYEYVSVVTPSGRTEKRPCEPHTHYCGNFVEGKRKIAGDGDFDPEDAPGWCPRWEEKRLKENAGIPTPIVLLEKQSDPETFTAPERDIRTVTLEIRTLTRQVQQIVLGYAIEIGRRLVEAKEMLPHGEWGRWLKEEVEFSQRTANYMMQIFDELGASQLGLFGPESNSQTLANLPYTKALRLLALPSEEREEFVEEHDVENLSTRELDKLVRERDEARRRAQDAEGKAEQALIQAGNSAEVNQELLGKLEEARKMAEEADAEAARLERELEELRSRPVDVAVEAADPKELEAARKEAAAAARKEAEDQLKKKIETADQKRAAAEQELAGLKEKQKAAEETARNAREEMRKVQADTEETIRREKETAAARIAAMEKQLRASKSPEIMTFGFHFEAAKGSFNSMTGCLKKLQMAGDAANHNKLLTATKALAQAILDNAPAAMEEGGDGNG